MKKGAALSGESPSFSKKQKENNTFTANRVSGFKSQVQRIFLDT